MLPKVSDFLTPEQARELGAKSNLMGALLVAHAWGLIAASMALFAWWPNPFTFLLGVMVIGGRQLGLAILMHDAAHGLLFANRRLIIERAAALRLPAIYEWPEMAEEGGLIGYGARLTSIFRQAARMVVEAFRGVKPIDIPIEQPTKFELVVNLKTAKTLGFTIPPSLLLRADEVIE